MEQETDFFGGVLKIALGLFLGALLIWMAIEYRARYELRQLDRAAEAVLQEAAQRERDARQSRQTMQRLDAERTRQVQSVRFERQQAADAERRRKAAAWASFYEPSAQCLNDATVECGNQHMRARKEFERRYAAGDL